MTSAFAPGDRVRLRPDADVTARALERRKYLCVPATVVRTLGNTNVKVIEFDRTPKMASVVGYVLARDLEVLS